jgi:anti-sigma factor RsiW
MDLHERWTELLARRAELTGAEEAELLAHLAACPACRQTAAEFEQTAALLRMLPHPEPPPELRRKVWEALGRPRMSRQP